MANPLLEKAAHQRPATTRRGALERLFTLMFQGFVYNQIWEDPEVDLAALELKPHHRVLTIASGGCNVLNYLAADPAIRSNTSVCLQFADRSDPDANKARQKAIVKLLDDERAAYDIGAYRDAPPGLRIWCGATVETADIGALGPWLDWAWEQSA